MSVNCQKEEAVVRERKSPSGVSGDLVILGSFGLSWLVAHLSCPFLWQHLWVNKVACLGAFVAGYWPLDKAVCLVLLHLYYRETESTMIHVP